MERTSPVTETPEVATSALLHSNLVPNSSAGSEVTDNSLTQAKLTEEQHPALKTMSDNIHSSTELSAGGDTQGVDSSAPLTERNFESPEVTNESNAPAEKCQENVGSGWDSADLNEAIETHEEDEYSDVDSYSGTEDDYANGSGNESDIEDNDDTILYPGQFMRRDSNPVLPETVTVLTTDKGCKVYLVGTAHFSRESQEDVAQVIRAVQPDVVMVELCSSRISILQMDEKSLLEEAKNINLEKIRSAIKQSGVIQGVLHLLLLSMSAHITKQLGMAPGGEFRTAFIEARKVPGCRVHLGDRPIQITLRRAIAALSVFQKMTLAWYMIFNKDPISKEEVEKCKQKDLLEEMLAEMTGEYPALSEVFVHERDLYLARSLRTAAEPLKHPEIEGEIVPSVVVGVVGIGHCKGIKDHWDDEHIDIRAIMQIPKSSLFSRSFKWIFRGAMVGLTSWLAYRIGRGWIMPLVWPWWSPSS